MKHSIEASEVSGIPVLDRPQVLQVAQAVLPSVMEWIKPYPVILPLRVSSTCLACAAMSPYAPQEAIVLSAAFSLVVFALDDVVDGVIGSYSEVELDQWLGKWAEVVQLEGKLSFELENSGSILSPAEQVTVSLARFCRELKNFPGASTLYPFFSNLFTSIIESTRIELNWQQQFKHRGSYPHYSEYLANGQFSIAAPGVVVGLLIMTSPADPGSELALLKEVALGCGKIIRLANDLRSYEREKLEQKPNSLSILMHKAGLSEEQAEALVLEETAAAIKRLHDLVERLPSTLRDWGDSVKRLAWFSKDWYQVREFHDFSKEQLAALSSSKTGQLTGC
jgi:hypothetical protein